MQSLRNISLFAVLKFGQWREVDDELPRNIIEDLNTFNEVIGIQMSGFGYFDFEAIESIRFNIEWDHGKWIFELLGGPMKTIAVFRQILTPNEEIFIPSFMCDIFALSCTEALFMGFWIKSYQLYPLDLKVVYYGHYIDSYGVPVRFTSEFHYLKEHSCLFIRTFGRVSIESILRFHSERTFYESSTEEWALAFMTMG